MSEPEIDMFYADVAFLETAGTNATKVKAALWAYLHLRDNGIAYLSLYDIRAWLVGQGFDLFENCPLAERTSQQPRLHTNAVANRHIWRLGRKEN